MNCDEAKCRCHQRLDFGVNDAGLEAHLRDCAKCRNYAARMGGLVAQLQALGAATENIERKPAPIAEQSRSSGVARQSIAKPFASIARIAAGFVIAATVWIAWQRTATVRHEPRPGATARHVPVESQAKEPDAAIRLQGDSRRELFAVAGATKDKNVRAFVLYHRE